TKRRASPSSPDNEQSPPEHTGRQRSRAACTPCRQRKRKCDGKLPCGTCQRYEYECHFSTTKRVEVGVNGNSPSTTIPSKSPLTAPGARFHHRAILDPVKTRFVRANSAIAFPRILGMDLESDTIPRLHSFAWNTGIRPELTEETTPITTLLTWSDWQRLSRVYFTVIWPEFSLLDESELPNLVSSRFQNPLGSNDLDAVIFGVAALGSFFSSTPHPKEKQFTFIARKVLTQRSVNGPTTHNITGWILRTLYLRLTSRPHGSWMSSCITMHQAEASGLHKELQTISVVYPQVPIPDPKLQTTRRKLFHIARALNVILSFEYGRSRVTLDLITTKPFPAEEGSSAHEFVALADLLPCDSPGSESDPPAALGTALSRLAEGPKTHSAFLMLLKADLSFAIYRRLWLMSLTDAKDRVEVVLGLGKEALSAARELLEMGRAWWGLIHTPFQFLCVVLAASTPRALGYVKEVMGLLRRVGEIFETFMVKEAVRQARELVVMARKRKLVEVGLLEVEGVETAAEEGEVTGGEGVVVQGLQDWGAFEWDVFLNPALVV
ncbi:hypothetical protein K470DRAFT_208077, partial [Piedraia hortae CBS 480.64]